jgi:hypothetical protein
VSRARLSMIECSMNVEFGIAMPSFVPEQVIIPIRIQEAPVTEP